jgi:phage shock protein A
MTSLIARGWRYVGALFSSAFDQVADPRIQVQMALEEARRQHQLLTEQAAAVLGNERELEIKVGRAMAEVERMRTAAGRALMLADRAYRAGDEPTARGHEETAALFAVQLAGAESMAAELADARDRSASAAAVARRAVDGSAHLLHARLTEGSRLTTEIEAARMQERMAATLTALDAMAPSGSIPTLEQIRARVDRRVSIAAARSELAGSGTGARMLEIERAGLEETGRQKLLEIRQALGLPERASPSSGYGTPLVERGDESGSGEVST